VGITKGTLVMCAMRSSSMEEACYANAAQFDPERWLAAGINKKASMPFGAGPRICPGRYLARLEMKVALVMLLARFDIEAVETGHGGRRASGPALRWRRRRYKCGCVCAPETREPYSSKPGATVPATTD
jgi:cytochrome P450